MGLTHDINIIKQDYRKTFHLAHRELNDLFEDLKSDYLCPDCKTEYVKVDVLLHDGCKYIEWQKKVVIALDQVVGKKILETLNNVRQTKEIMGKCNSCGVCCSLASSEFSYDELLNKSENGDNFARQFTSIFIPYESPEHARIKFPDLVSEILEQSDGEVYFYYCPHLGKDNLCNIYNQPERPPICADYPETPIVLMYKNCGYQPWKTKMLSSTLYAHAMLELCQHYIHKINDLIGKYK